MNKGHQEPGPALGTILRNFYPGALTLDGTKRPVLTWEDYSLVKDDNEVVVADRCINEFWVIEVLLYYFKLELFHFPTNHII